MEEPASSSSSILRTTTRLRERHSSYSSFYCYADLRKSAKMRLNILHIVFVSLFLTVGVLDARLLDTSVSCDQNNFILSLNFDSPFQGIVYSEEGFPNCVYVNGTMLSHTSYHLKIPLVGCETHTNLDGNFENAIIIQESDRLLQATDKKYLLTCIPSPIPPLTSNSLGGSGMSPHSKDSVSPNRKENMITVDFGGVTVENSHTTTEIIRGTLPSVAGAMPTPELKYAVEIRHGHSLDSPAIQAALNIGDPISYMVRLQKPVADSQIGRCWATDTKSNLELADEHGCSLQPRGNIWGAFERLETSKEVVFVNRIKAWAFPTSNEVNIFCNLRVCMSHFCSFANCTEASEPAKRLRRHHQMVLSRGTSDTGTLSDLSKVETLTTSIRVRRHSPTSELSAAIAPTKLVTGEPVMHEDGVCLKKEELWLIAGCAFLFLVLVLMGGWMAMRYCGEVVKAQQQHQELEHNKVALEECRASRKSASAARNVDRNVRI